MLKLGDSLQVFNIQFFPPSCYYFLYMFIVGTLFENKVCNKIVLKMKNQLISRYPSIMQWCSAFVVVVQSLGHVQSFTAPWTVAHQAPLSMGFPRQEYWSGLPFPSPGEPSQPRNQTWISRIAGRFFTI